MNLAEEQMQLAAQPLLDHVVRFNPSELYSKITTEAWRPFVAGLNLDGFLDAGGDVACHNFNNGPWVSFQTRQQAIKAAGRIMALLEQPRVAEERPRYKNLEHLNKIFDEMLKINAQHKKMVEEFHYAAMNAMESFIRK